MLLLYLKKFVFVQDLFKLTVLEGLVRTVFLTAVHFYSHATLPVVMFIFFKMIKMYVPNYCTYIYYYSLLSDTMWINSETHTSETCLYCLIEWWKILIFITHSIIIRDECLSFIKPTSSTSFFYGKFAKMSDWNIIIGLLV